MLDQLIIKNKILSSYNHQVIDPDFEIAIKSMHTFVNQSIQNQLITFNEVYHAGLPPILIHFVQIPKTTPVDRLYT